MLSAHLALIGTQIAFGLFPVVGKIIFAPGGLSPLAVVAWRLAAGSVILVALAAGWYGRAIIPARGDLARFVAAAALGVGFNQGLYLEGLARSTPINATLVMCLIPIFTFVMAAVIGLERFSVSRLAGVLIALAGTLPLLLDHGVAALGPYGLGNLIMVGGTLCYSGYLVLSKPLVRRYPPMVVIAWSYVFSLPLLPLYASGQELAPPPGHPAAWWSLAYIIVFPTVLAYLLNMFALARVQASTAAIYIYAQPLITGLASWAAFGETATRPMLLAAPALFTGIWLVSRRPSSAMLPAA